MTDRSPLADVAITLNITSRPLDARESPNDAPTDEDLSDRAIAIAGMFGLTSQDLVRPRPPITPATTSELRCRPGSIVLVTGPSGAGKSCVLGSIQDQLTQRSHAIRCRLCDMRSEHNFDAPTPSAPARVIDVIEGDLQHATSALARAGLADAFLMVRHVHDLSAGERARLSLAQLISQVERDRRDGACVLLIDEFASLLDRETARGLAHRIRRWIATPTPHAHPRLSVVVATAHDDILESLRPDILVVVEGAGAIDVTYAEDHLRDGRAIA